jgi:putative flippase GtrA
VTTPSHRPLSQFARYILVGGFNTLFGYSLFALLNWLFSRFSNYSYLYAALLGNVFAITVAFLGYKWFVFRTRGNYLIEWIRCVGVYGSMMLINLAGLSILVPIFRHHLQRPQLAPYLAGALLTAISVILSFFGHKKISFSQKIPGDHKEDRSDSRHL